MSILTGDALFPRVTIATVVWEQQVDPSRRQGGRRGRNHPAPSGAPKHRIVNGISERISYCSLVGVYVVCEGVSSALCSRGWRTAPRRLHL